MHQRAQIPVLRDQNVSILMEGTPCHFSRILVLSPTVLATAAAAMRFLSVVNLLSGALYCYRSCLCASGGRADVVFVALWGCYHDNSKLHASIFTKLGL